MEGGNPPACLVALDYLQENEVNPVSECLPPGSTSIYIPARNISKLFEDEPHGLTLERLFLCPCYRCVQDGGSVEDRSTRFNKLREQELRGEYSLMYALLIYIRRPALIRKFQRHELKLEGTMYLRDSDFDRLKKENIFNLHLVRRKVLETQYSFLVRILKPFSDITAISAKELLPINEDLKPKGTGTFAEVWCFAFQYDEYRSREFGEHITRFARKIFKQDMETSAAKEWNNLQRLSKEENHPHLMVALGAYWHGNQFFILQEEAEQSLHDYLQGEGEEFDSDELWKQMKGVADGLATLHKLYKGTKIAYHQDLKPANILILKRRLKIADFGLLEFKPVSLADDTGSTGVPNAHNTGNYAAPRQGKYTRDSDIWSLGCIMSELATCDIQGRERVKSYREARIADGSSGKDTPRFFSGQVVKDSVLKMHNLLYDYVRSGVPAGRTAMSMQFQKKFYTKNFFDLMNSMFRKMDQSTYLLEVLNEPAVPDAGRVAETIERLRSAAVPASALDDEIKDLTLEQHLLDTDVLGTSFEAQLTGFKEILNPQNRKKFPNTTLADLKQCIVNLQAKQHTERRQQGLKRLIPFLEGFQHFSEIIKGLPGATEFMSFIWGPARFLLEATDGRADAFSDLIDIYGRAGRSQPSQSMYKELFVTDLDLTQILSAAYQDIIEVNKWLVLYFQQRLWPKLFATTWKRHNLRFSGAMIRMASRFDLISSRASVSEFDSFLHVSALKEEQHLAAMDRENLGRRQAVHAWLKPTEMENEQYHLARIRAAYPGTCRWLLDDETFKEWFDPKWLTTTSPTLLWLNGKPGSGKTVLASLVVEEARKLRPVPTVLFFYFKQEDNDRNDFLAMARTFLMQILEQNPQALDDFYSKCCSSGGVPLTSRALVGEYLKFALQNCDSAYMVLDGLDECCSRRERGEIVSWFREILENPPQDAHDQLRCLFVSQHDSARKDYRHLPSITVDADHNEEDIEFVCKRQSQRLVVKLGISEKRASEIAASVSASADGIFLFAYLVWVNLCGQSSIHSLEQEMKSYLTDLDRLDKIYARIMQTIVNKPARAEREEALMLLGWLVCAKRSLKMHEIQTMKSIDLQGRTVDFERRRFLVHPKDLCESLVDVREDGTIELVHNTARSHLANNSYLNVVAEEIRLATLCINYLNLPSFRAPITEEAVLAGEFGFMDYAILYWLRHLEAGLTSSSSRQDELFQDLAESLEVFVEQHWNNPTAKLSLIPNRTRDMLGIFSGSQRYLDIQLAVVLTDKELKYFGDIRREQRALDFADVASGVRCRLETVVRNKPAQSIIDDLELKYGTHLFKCPRFSCTYFTEGFSTSDERERHVERHKRPARCTDEHCRGSKIGFARQEDLARHMRENHPDMTERRHEFPTEEEIIESVRQYQPEPETGAEVGADAEAETQPDPDLQIPEAAMTPVLEPAVPQPTRPTEASKRRKIKQDFECEHCHKKFNKKFNWQSHLATHSNSQTQCPCCDTTFRRSADLVRHMKSVHNPDSVITCGGMLSNGQHWGCGKTFARADILHTHHKSTKGKQCIAERDSGD